VQDVKAAVRYLRANAERFHIDPERFGAVGFSAGAHLAMLLGTMERADGLDDVGVAPGLSSKVQAVVSYAGPADFELPATDIAGPLIADFLGGPREARRDVYRRASPVAYVSAGDAPMLFFHGADDEVVPPLHSTRMAEALRAAGVEGRVELLPDAGHGDWKPELLARTQAETLVFLRERLLPTARGVGAHEAERPAAPSPR
jgi:acetyl esterase/lipase